MKIAVCVKAVPDTESRISVAGDKQNIEFTGIKFITSPYDENAVEEAIRLKEKHGGETVAFSLGGDEATDVLRDTMARGVDSAVHLKDADFANADPLMTAKALAAAIKDGGFDLIGRDLPERGGDGGIRGSGGDRLTRRKELLGVESEAT